MWQAPRTEFARNSERNRQAERNSSRHRCLYLQLPSDALSRASCKHPAASPGLQLASRDPCCPGAGDAPARGCSASPPGPAATAPPAARPLTHAGGRGGVSMAAPLGLQPLAPAAASTIPAAGRLPRPPVAPRPIRPGAPTAAPHLRLHRHPLQRPRLPAQLCSRTSRALSACRRCWGGAAEAPGCDAPSRPRPASRRCRVGSQGSPAPNP